MNDSTLENQTFPGNNCNPNLQAEFYGHLHRIKTFLFSYRSFFCLFVAVVVVFVAVTAAAFVVVHYLSK